MTHIPTGSRCESCKWAASHFTIVKKYDVVFGFGRYCHEHWMSSRRRRTTYPDVWEETEISKEEYMVFRLMSS